MIHSMLTTSRNYLIIIQKKRTHQ